MNCKLIAVVLGIGVPMAAQPLQEIIVGKSDVELNLISPAFGHSNAGQERERRARERSNPDKIRDNRKKDVKPKDSYKPKGRIDRLTNADKTQLDKCVDQMLLGRFSRSVVKTNIMGHSFECHRSVSRKLHRRWRIEGLLSISTKTVSYQFVISEDGNIDEVRVDGSTIYVEQRGNLFGRDRKGASKHIVATMVRRLETSTKLARKRNQAGRSSRIEWGVERLSSNEAYKASIQISLKQNQNHPIFCERVCFQKSRCTSWSFVPATQNEAPLCFPSAGYIQKGEFRFRSASGIKPIAR